MRKLTIAAALLASCSAKPRFVDNRGDLDIQRASDDLQNSAAPLRAPFMFGANLTNHTQPTWTWRGAESGSGWFRTKLNDSNLDAEAEQTRELSWVPSSPLAEGIHTLYVQERGAPGQWSQASGFAIHIDVTAPEVPAIDFPILTRDRQPEWNWEMLSDDVMAVRFSLNDASTIELASETTAKSFKPENPLFDGPQSLYMQVRDRAGNWSQVARFELTIDTLPPAAPQITAMTPTNLARPVWTWTGAADGNGTFRHKLNDANLNADAVETTELSFSPNADLAEGTHALYVQERDAAGNWSSSGMFAVVIDRTPPSAPLVSGPGFTNNVRPTWNWQSGGNAGSGRYRLRLDNNDLSTITTETTATSYTPAQDLSEAPHTLYVQERDAAGNWSASGQFTINIDLTPPGAPTVTSDSITGPASNPIKYSKYARPVWRWASHVATPGNGTFRFKINDANLTNGATITTALTHLTASDLNAGDNTIYVQERDAAGNWSSNGQFTLHLDLTPPLAPTVIGPMETNNQRPVWSWSANGGGIIPAEFRFRLNNSSFEDLDPTTTATSFAPLTNLAEGAHTLYVQERDIANNWSESGQYTITVDLTKPNPPTVTGPAFSASAQPVWSIASTGGGSGLFRARIGDENFDLNSPTFTGSTFSPANPLTPDGVYTLFVQERDNAGNWSMSATASTEIDTKPPAAPVNFSVVEYGGQFLLSWDTPEASPGILEVGARYVIVRRLDAAVSFAPAKGVAYTTGTQGQDQYVVYFDRDTFKIDATHLNATPNYTNPTEHSGYNYQIHTVDRALNYSPGITLNGLLLSTVTSPTVVGGIGGKTTDVAQHAGFAYVSHARGLDVISIAEPTGFRVIRNLLTDSPVVAMAAYQASLYAVTESREIRTYNIDTAPAVGTPGVLSLDGNNSPKAARVHADRLYVAQGTSGMRILSLSNPSAPMILNTVAAGIDAKDVAFSSQHLVVAAGADGVRVFNLANLGESPVEIAAQADAVAAEGSLLAVADQSSQTVRLYNLDDLAAGIIATIPNQANIHKMVLDGHLYLTGQGLLTIIDVTNPAAPVQLSQDVRSNAIGQSLIVSDQSILLTSDRHLLARVDASITTNPQIASLEEVWNAMNPTAIAWTDSVAVISDRSFGIVLADSSDPALGQPNDSSPVQTVSAVDLRSSMGQDPLPQLASLATSGSAIYAADSTSGTIKVLDASSPLSPTLANSVADAAGPLHATAARLYSGRHLLSVFNLTDGAASLLNPEGVSELDMGEFSMAISGNDQAAFAVVGTASDRELVGISIAGNGLSIERQRRSFGNTPLALAQHENRLYVGTSDNGLHILDASRPSSLLNLGDSLAVRNIKSMAASRDYLYVVDQNNTLHTFDITNPIEPEKLFMTLSIGANVTGLHVRGRALYAITSDKGIVVIRGVPGL